MKKKIYIAGAGGMLGEAFYRIFKDDYEVKCTDKDVNEKWLSFLDFRDLEKYKRDVYDYKPDYLFHLFVLPIDAEGSTHLSRNPEHAQKKMHFQHSLP